MKEDTVPNRKASPVNGVERSSEAEKHQINFNKFLIDSLDEAVTEVLDVKTSSILWRHYEAFLGITREEMPDHLPKLFESIQIVFGTGDETVGERVIRKLYAKANIPLKYSHNRPLVEYAEELKQILAKESEQI
jgi:hypothetical protein